MISIKEHKEKTRTAIFYCLILFPLIFLIIRGNFLIDDWGQLSTGTTIVSQISSWESLWAYRPISWIALPIAVNVLGNNFALLMTLHLTLYLFTVFQIVSWRSLNLSLLQQRVLAILLLSPFFASTFILSPVNQLSASLSFFFFAIGLLVEKRLEGRRNAYTIIYLCFLFSLLSYEISFPLIITHYLFTISSKSRKLSDFSLFPVVLALLIFWQKVIAVYVFNSDFSRLEAIDVIPFVSFILTYLVSIPYALALGIADYALYIFFVAVLLFSVYVRSLLAARDYRHEPRIVIVLSLGFLSSGFLFLLSGRYSLIEGYQNRGLTSSWILFSIILVWLLRYRKLWLLVLVTLIVAVNYVLFVGKVTEAVTAGEARREVVAEIIDQESLVNGSSSTIILDVPCLLPGGNFRSEVFCTSWDARGALLNKGFGFENVFVTGDSEDPLPVFLNNLSAEELIHLVKFNLNFEIVRVDKLTLDLRENLISQSEFNLSESNSKIEACKTKISELIKFKFSGSLNEYLQCAKHPLS